MKRERQKLTDEGRDRWRERDREKKRWNVRE